MTNQVSIIFAALRAVGVPKEKAQEAARAAAEALEGTQQEPLLKAASVAKRLDTSKRWVTDAMKAGEFGAVFFVSGGFRVTESAVSAYVKNLPVHVKGSDESRKEDAA